MNDRIKRVSDLPLWFDLNKYKLTKQLDAAEWYEQLSIRYGSHSAFNRSREDTEHEEDKKEALEFVDYVITKIQENPIIDILTDTLLSEELSCNTLDELKQRKPHYTLGVHKLTVNEFFEIERCIDKPLKQMRNQRNNSSARPGKWIYKPLHKLHRYDPIMLHEVVHIDWELPDAILIEHFKQFLKSQRPRDAMIEDDKEYNDYIKKCQRKPDFNTWYRTGVLPYLDLTLWASRLNINIPYRVMADAIYPNGDYGEETIRKTTAPLAGTLISETALDSLANYAALTIVEKQ